MRGIFFYLISDEHLIKESAHFFFLLVMLRLGHIWVTWLILSLGGIPERVIVLLLHAKSTHENTESTSDDLTAPLTPRVCVSSDLCTTCM